MTIPEAFAIGLQHHQSGRLGEAEQIYRQILAVDPLHADALHMMGVIAYQVGRNDLAVDWIGKAIGQNPNDPAYHSNLGAACLNAGRMDEAIAACRTAIRLQPEYADAHSNLGVALAELGLFEEASAACRRAISLKPDYVEANYNLGNALRNLGQLHEAVAAYQQALQLRPDYAEAHNNLGLVFSELRRLDEAKVAYRRAIELKPDYAEAHNNLGLSHKDHGEFDSAVAHFRRAMEINPVFAQAHSNLLLTLHYSPASDAQVIFAEHGRWNQSHAEPLAQNIEIHRNDCEPERRLRLGYVSPDFHEHPVTFFIEGLLAAHDRTQFEIFCYADQFREDAVTGRLRHHAGQWRKIAGMKDGQVSELIRNDGVDILVDLAGHTAGNRLLVFARKPAPVQATWLGYCDTTGMKTIDYRVTDAYADPPGTTEQLHSEALVRLPDIFACFHPVADSPPVNPLPAMGRGHVTFGSFHTLAKLNDGLLGWWARILCGTPGSRLLMVGTGLDETSQQERLREFFGSRGIEPARIGFKGRRSLADYLALHEEVDVLLDSHPFAGHTTGCHALWMGVPVVTLAGKTHCSRMVGSVLHTLGLAEWIAGTPEEYVRIACEAGGDLPRLAQLRATLRERMKASPLMDAPRFARNMEVAYRQMWRARCAKQCSNPAR